MSEYAAEVIPLALPIRTERLLLRAHRLEDLDDLVRFHSDPAVVRYLPWPVRDRAATERALVAKIDQAALRGPGEWLVLAVELCETGMVIGEVLLKWDSAEHRQGELGFAFAGEHHGRGLAAEAATEMLRLGFDRLGLHRITAVCVEANTASAALLRRLGFRQEAWFVDNMIFKGEWVTQLVFAMTEDAWGSRARPPRSDLEEVRALLDCFFAAFTSGEPAAVDQRLGSLRAAMLPEAVVVRTGGLEPAAYDVESFIAPRRAMLVDGTLIGFAERATTGRLEMFGDVAHWFGGYAKDGRLDGAPCPGAGMKSIQFVRTGTGWRISAVAWDDARPADPSPDHQVVDGFPEGGRSA